jgi:1-aminocyclopropane-1-carboxylate deaminase/D-cysteine desulfhydrase-like pyridoxal-dependent ACC family enzyme
MKRCLLLRRFSNHIAAVAYAGKENGFKTIGIIRMKSPR